MDNDDKIKVMFDTLAYSQGLKSKGVAQSETFATQLAQALSENIYTKCEVDKMIQDSLRELREQRLMMEKKLDKSSDDLRASIATNEKSITELRTEMIKLNSRTISIIVSVLSGVIVITGAVSTLTHFLH